MIDFRQRAVKQIREQISKGEYSIGSWMQLPNSSVAEIIGDAGYDWVVVDLEHGSIGVEVLPDLFRSLELGNTVPLARLAEGNEVDCKQVLDAGAGGVIIPMVETAEQLEQMVRACCWPPTGTRGVGFSRANLFGKYFDNYRDEAQSPFVVAMIETITGLNNLESIVDVEGLDAILVGPYDLSASMECTACFDDIKFKRAIEKILLITKRSNIPCGIHVVNPSVSELRQRVEEGYRFIPYSIDSVFFNHSTQCPILFEEKEI